MERALFPDQQVEDTRAFFCIGIKGCDQDLDCFFTSCTHRYEHSRLQTSESTDCCQLVAHQMHLALRQGSCGALSALTCSCRFGIRAGTDPVRSDQGRRPRRPQPQFRIFKLEFSLNRKGAKLMVCPGSAGMKLQRGVFSAGSLDHITANRLLNLFVSRLDTR